MTEQVVKVETEQNYHYADAIDEIVSLIRGCVPIIWVVTHEENRFIKEFISRVIEPEKRQLWAWSSYQGLINIKSEDDMGIGRAGGEEKDTHVITKALKRIAEMPQAEEGIGTCYIMRDMQIVLAENIVRQIRDMFEHLIGQNKTLIIVSPVMAHGGSGSIRGIPPTMEKQIVVVNYELPNFELIKARIIEAISIIKNKQLEEEDKSNDFLLDYPDNEISLFARALCGLTLLEIDNAIATSMTHLKRLHLKKLINEKKRIISKSDILEFIDSDESIENVGGLDHAKSYLEKYVKAQSSEARAFGVEPLKGIILTGIPGSGKSLFSKVIGKMWDLPLLRLNIGKVMTGLVGGSEGKMREVIQLVEAMAPCILWIDEVEKELSGTKSSNFSDGGTLSRVFGTLLHAMQDRMEGVTIIATSNDISSLPPEFIRRFNDVFFVDLPGPEERWDIFNIHLRKRNRDILSLEKHKQTILKASENYTGAEIEKAIKDAIAAAFYNGFKDINHKDILKALKDTKPISKVMKEKINSIREKARGHYRYASSWAEKNSRSRKVTTKKGKELDVNSALDDLPEIVKTQKEKSKAEISSRKSRFNSVVTE
jgi:SpoVK/Ycf46/Vps4 family AAA+-type ATPase